MTSEVCQALKTHEIDGSALMELTRDDMQLLGITVVKDRRDLLSRVEGLAAPVSVSSPAEAALPQAEALETVLQHNSGL